MKAHFSFLFVVLALCALARAEDKKEEVVDSKDEAKAKTYQRIIPADVLRDFPGMCFASTRCATVEPGRTWELAPFCGRSTCVVSEDQPPRLLELVEDCGPLPVPNPKCKVDAEKTNKTAPFPACCPTFVCEDGVKLEYPEFPTPAPAEAGAATSSTEKPKA
ncbi:uncharacterized protein LOC143909383 [Arctopsyche grandis]|uniref:uncharacterized protein LOC143909383 n=1 Tax=Arctopsyche grandis TaxID=121162 RepID=UPI00406D9ACE